MLHYYIWVKLVHVGCVVLSGGVFVVRGLLSMRESALANHRALKRVSYLIDTTLLTAAIVLVICLHQYPFVQGWLTVKVLLLPAYIFMGVLALRAKSAAIRARAFAAALIVYAFIISVAVTHSPRGWFA